MPTTWPTTTTLAGSLGQPINGCMGVASTVWAPVKQLAGAKQRQTEVRKELADAFKLRTLKVIICHNLIMPWRMPVGQCVHSDRT